jgi:hypothetical protein
LATTAVPLATTNKTRSCYNKNTCIMAPHSDHLKLRIL